MSILHIQSKPCSRSRQSVVAGAVVAAAILGFIAQKEVASAASGRECGSDFVAVNGTCQYLLIRGRNADAPALLWLHGGPGGSETPFFRLFNAPLEQTYQVAYWDQRGAGRSFDPQASTARLTIAQMLDDLDVVLDKVRTRTGRSKIMLIGHSWGAALGLLYAQRHPEKVSVFIGVGQPTSTIAQDRERLRFAAANARSRHDRRALAEIKALGPVPFDRQDGIVMDRLDGTVWWDLAPQAEPSVAGSTRHPRRYRTHKRCSALHPCQRSNPRRDVARAAGGSTLQKAWRRCLYRSSFALGRYDEQIPANLSAAYFRTLSAPRKRLIWFEQAAHNIPAEQPVAFDAVIADLEKWAR